MKIFRFPTLNKELIELRKLLLILAAILILPIRICSAEVVQVSDEVIGTFIARCNEILATENQRFRVEAQERLGIFTLYVGGLGDSATTFFVNDDGTVSKIAVISKNASKTSIELGKLSTAACLHAIGLSETEIRTLMTSTKNPPSLWCPEIERRIFFDDEKSTPGVRFRVIKASDD